MKKVSKDKKSKKNYLKWFENFYNDLLELGTIFRKSDNQKRTKIIVDLLFLVVVTCVLKIPFIFVRNLGDNLIGVLFSGNINVLAIWGLVIELVYAVAALTFFMKTLKKWLNSID